MTRIFILIMFGLLAFTGSAKAVVFTDPAVLSAILQQTATQTTQHLNQLAQEIQTVQTLEQQLSSTQGILQIAQANSSGADVLQTIADFRNTVLAANNVIQSIQSDINTSQNLESQWQTIFGSLSPWIQSTDTAFANIDVSDKMNTASYLVGDSYQKLYDQNNATVAQFVANANQVSEKGALKQIAQEVAELIQMENNVIYLLSQSLKGQSIESSNANLNRKEDAVQAQDQSQGVSDFMAIVDNNTFNI